MKNVKKSYKNSEFKMPASTWNEKCDYLMHHIQYFYREYCYFKLGFVYSVGITETKLKKSEATIQTCSFETVFVKTGKILEKTCEKGQFLVKMQPVGVLLY